MAAWCKTCNYYDAEASEPLYSNDCLRCQNVIKIHPELVEWILGVVERKVNDHERDNRHTSSDYWD